MSAAPSWPLISSPVRGEPSEARLASPPGCISTHSETSKPNVRILILNLNARLSERKTTRGALTAPARPNQLRHGLKKPEIAYLPTACAETDRKSTRLHSSHA